MKIAIHKRVGSFSDGWIDYCENNNLDYKLVDCYDNNIIENLHDCDILLWHHHHGNVKDILTAKAIIFSLENQDIKVFPDFNTSWHFDDKLGQKYLLESINAPMIPTYIFYSKQKALKWVSETTFPKVFKLKTGAGSANVRLVRTKKDAIKLINKSFSSGFKQFDGYRYFKDQLKKYKSGIIKLTNLVKAFFRIFISTKYSKEANKEKNYIYFQDFIDNNDSDVRVIVIDSKAFAIKRMVREGDFRASGSGKTLYEKEHFNNETLKIAFEVSKKLKSNSCALDFVYDENSNPVIVEISYCFTLKVYSKCEGYWDEDLNFHKGTIDPLGWMIESCIKSIKE